MHINIHTSYFANHRHIPPWLTTISIARYPPKGWCGFSYPALAPSDELLHSYKKTNDVASYTDAFKRQLAELNPSGVVCDLAKISDGGDVVLLCFEKPEKFCHRHLVADWFRSAGYRSGEF